MTFPRTRRVSRLGLVALAGSALLLGTVGPSSARPVAGASGEDTATCFDPAAWGLGSGAARGGRGGLDHSDISAAQQRTIERRTAKILAAKARGKGRPGTGGGGGGAGGGGGGTTTVSVPVYIHEMRAANGDGDVTPAQITAQIAELNQDFAGGEGGASSGFTFTLAGADEYFNDAWHADQQSTTYRAETRRGGKNALNIWYVDFAYLGIATFPWEYSTNGAIDGIRVLYSSVPGGATTGYNEGKTASHEAGHWFGLYHTFQGGCKDPGDEVADTPAQKSPTAGCPEGRDSCRSQPGLDPIHNYMDYSVDSCYDQFTAGQVTRMKQNWAAYRS